MELLSTEKPYLASIARRAFEKYCGLHGFEHYAGILALHGMARLAIRTGAPRDQATIVCRLRPFADGRMEWRGNFPNYFAGGNATAYLLSKDLLSEAEDTVRERGGQQDKQPRDGNGLFRHPRRPDQDAVWIDTAFAVTPFYLYAGLALEKSAWVDEAVHQALGHCRLLRNEDTGLLFQCVNFAGPGQLSEDHWSRGNGWGLHALTALILDLPATHARRQEVEACFVSLIDAALKLQNDQGCWHQEMTDPKSYVESSGTFLILQAIGAGIEAGVLDESYAAPLWRGLSGGVAYIAGDDFTVHNCCGGCLCPGAGTKTDYAARGSILNDIHAFGPITHAFEQAMAVDFSARFTASPNQKTK